MAKTSKHKRKSGATTIKHDGKIVGNIGKGKTNIPTSNENLKSSTTQKIIKASSPIAQRTEKFAMLQKDAAVDKNNQRTEMTTENIVMMWNMTREQPVEERVQFIVNFITKKNRKAIYQWCDCDMNRRENISVLSKLAENTDDPQLLDLLATTKNIGIWRTVFDNPHMSLETLEAISKSKESEKKSYVAYHPRVSPEISARLAKDRGVKIRRSVAYSSYTPPAVLEMLAEDKDVRVCCIVAENKNTPPSALSILSRSFSLKVREKVTRNPHTPIETLQTLENEDPDYYVRISATRNLQHRAGKG